MKYKMCCLTLTRTARRVLGRYTCIRTFREPGQGNRYYAWQLYWISSLQDTLTAGQGLTLFALRFYPLSSGVAGSGFAFGLSLLLTQSGVMLVLL